MYENQIERTDVNIFEFDSGSGPRQMSHVIDALHARNLDGGSKQLNAAYFNIGENGLRPEVKDLINKYLETNGEMRKQIKEMEKVEEMKRRKKRKKEYSS